MHSKKITIKQYFIAFLFCLVFVLIGLLIHNQLQEQGASSPEEAWSRLLIALQDEDIEHIRLLTTDNGLADLQYGIDEKEFLHRWHNAANYLIEHEKEGLHWYQIDEHTFRARCCGQKESTFIFISVSGEWKLDKFVGGS